jgi:hypothetical protein
MHCLECEQWGNSDEQTEQVEANIQDVHLKYDGILRCILTVEQPRSKKKSNICIFVIGQGNKMYTVRAWPDYLQEQVDIDIDQKNLKHLNYDE